MLIVPDFDAASDFYGGVLGFKISDNVEAGVKLRFFHCNPRHHTLAIAAVPGMVGVHHLMLEVGSIDDVGAALDIVNERGLSLAMTLGRHTNDLMTSFYVRTPSGFEIEYGTGGRLVDDNDVADRRLRRAKPLGPQAPGRTALPPDPRPVHPRMTATRTMVL